MRVPEAAHGVTWLAAFGAALSKDWQPWQLHVLRPSCSRREAQRQMQWPRQAFCCASQEPFYCMHCWGGGHLVSLPGLDRRWWTHIWEQMRLASVPAGPKHLYIMCAKPRGPPFMQSVMCGQCCDNCMTAGYGCTASGAAAAQHLPFSASRVCVVRSVNSTSNCPTP